MSFIRPPEPYSELIKKALGLSEKLAEGTATEEEKDDFQIWSPFLIPLEPLSFEKLLLLFVIAKYLKTPEDRKQLAAIAKQYLLTIGETMKSLAMAGGVNPLATVVHGEISVQVYRTLGLLSPHQASVLGTQLAWALNKMILKDALAGIASLTTAVFGSITPSGITGALPITETLAH